MGQRSSRTRSSPGDRRGELCTSYFLLDLTDLRGVIEVNHAVMTSSSSHLNRILWAAIGAAVGLILLIWRLTLG